MINKYPIHKWEYSLSLTRLFCRLFGRLVRWMTICLPPIVVPAILLPSICFPDGRVCRGQASSIVRENEQNLFSYRSKKQF